MQMGKLQFIPSYDIKIFVNGVCDEMFKQLCTHYELCLNDKRLAYYPRRGFE